MISCILTLHENDMHILVGNPKCYLYVKRLKKSNIFCVRLQSVLKFDFETFIGC